MDVVLRCSGSAGVEGDPLIATHEARELNAKYCVELIEELFAERTLAEWKEALSGQRGPFDPVQKTGELADDPQVVANGYLAEVEDDAGRVLRLVAPPVEFDGTHYQTSRGPDHGAHTDEVLAELGYDLEAVLQLKIEGAIL